MLQSNILTFNPGWDENAQNMEAFDDVRKIHTKAKEAGIEMVKDIETSDEGPASFIVKDPDGNMILFDQHR